MLLGPQHPISTQSMVRLLIKQWVCERVVEYQYRHTKEVSATLLPTKIIITPVGKSNSTFDHQTDINFAGNDVNK